MLYDESVTLLAAFGAALVMALVHKGLATLGRQQAATADGREIAFQGPAPDEDAAAGKSLHRLIAIVLIAILVAFDVSLPAPAVRAAARLFGFAPQVTVMNLPNSALFIATLLSGFLWVQIGHFVRLRSVWTRCRFVLLVVALPLACRTVLWLGIAVLDRHVILSDGGAYLAGIWSEFFAFGIVPFFVPAMHRRIYAPLATWTREHIGVRGREAAEYLGNAVLFLGTIALVAASAIVQAPVPNAPMPARTSTAAMPVPSGMPHICMNDYPLISLRLGEQGVTIVSFTITTEGTVKNIAVIRSSGSQHLDDAAVECVARWTYEPVSVNGQPAEAPWQAKVVWKLR
jgi:TonB family protein